MPQRLLHTRLSPTAATHVNKWRALSLYTKSADDTLTDVGAAGDAADVHGGSDGSANRGVLPPPHRPPQLCSDFKGCTSCRAGNNGTTRICKRIMQISHLTNILFSCCTTLPLSPPACHNPFVYRLTNMTMNSATTLMTSPHCRQCTQLSER
jgi:hypothetical protein